MTDQVKTYFDYKEILSIDDAAELCGISATTFREWIVSGQTPMGPLVEEVHFFRLGNDPTKRSQFKFVKYQLGLLFKMIPESSCPQWPTK